MTVGRNLLRALARPGISTGETDVASAIALVLQVASSAMRTGAYDLARFTEAHRQAAMVDNLTLARAMRDVLGVSEHPPHIPGRLSLHATAAAAVNWRTAVGSRLEALAVELRQQSYHAIAVPVYRLITTRVEDPDLHMRALLGLGWALRERHEFENAEFAYTCLREFARNNRKAPMRLEAELGLARIVGQRGDLVAMAASVSIVLRKARWIRDLGVQGKCHIDLAYVAGRRGDHKQVIRHCDDATLCGLPKMREERCLLNMAFAYWKLGWYGPAQDIGRNLATQSRDGGHRIEAALMLYDIAIARRDTDALGYYRALLRRAQLTPAQREEFERYRARETFLVYTPPSIATPDDPSPPDADADLVSIAERIRRKYATTEAVA